MKRPDRENRESGLQALRSALQLEIMLSKVLQDLKTSASENNEAALSDCVGEFLDKQMKDIAFLEYHLGCWKESEELAQWEALFEKAAAASGEEI